MTNHEIAGHFSLLSRLMDIHGENSFKIKSYTNAAYTIEKLPREVAAMDDAELFSQRGIGNAIGAKIREIQHSGKLDALESLLALTPPGVVDMMRVKGLGPKKIAIIWKEMGIESLGELEYACNENRLALQKGFGAKTQENIIQAIAFLRSNQGWYLWAEAAVFADALMLQLQQTFPEGRFAFTGSFRRQVETVNMIELVTDMSAAQLQHQFSTVLGAVVETESERSGRMMVQLPGQPAVCFYTSPQDRFYHTLFLTTGSEIFIQNFLAGYCLPDVADSEQAIFDAAGLLYIAPALREDAAVIERASRRDLPALITVQDIKGIIHSHSTWSDGRHTIEEMAYAAREKGFEYLVISDHSQSAYYANGLTPERIAAQHHEIDRLNDKLAPFRIFKGIEADILSDGSLDYSDSVLQTFDLVIASVHSNLHMPQERAMDRLMRAIRHPLTTILGHPTGRLLLSRAGYPVDHKVIIDACAAHQVVIEINAHPRRLDLDWRWIDYALEKGVLLSIDPDAHAIAGFDDIRYGVLVAQKGGLSPQYNLSSFSLSAFEAFLLARKSIIKT